VAAESGVESVSISALSPTHRVSNKAVERLAADVAENGVKEPLKYVEHRGAKYVVDGNHRLRAAARAGLKEVPAEKVSLPYKGYKTIENVLSDAP
jgi:ParB-like chromosome segregation protein Spo0J